MELKWSALPGQYHRNCSQVADYYIDLHSGDDYEKLTPYVYYAGAAAGEVVSFSRQMAEQVDVPYMVKSNVASGGSYNYAASQGIPSILIERGGMGDWTYEEVRSTPQDVRNILCHMGIYQGLKNFRTYYPLDVADIRYQDAEENGLWYPFKKVGDMIQEGDILGEVRDYEGNAKSVLPSLTVYFFISVAPYRYLEMALWLHTEELSADTTSVKSES